MRLSNRRQVLHQPGYRVLMVDPDNAAMMISCDTCNVWQHGPCMGIWGDDDAPDG